MVVAVALVATFGTNPWRKQVAHVWEGGGRDPSGSHAQRAQRNLWEEIEWNRRSECSKEQVGHQGRPMERFCIECSWWWWGRGEEGFIRANAPRNIKVRPDAGFASLQCFDYSPARCGDEGSRRWG